MPEKCAIFYEKLVSELKLKGLIIFPYNPCTTNMMVNGKQTTITWHFNGIKISHVDSEETTKIIEWMKGIYGSHMRESHGKKHD